jgi:hypothetical protein
MVWLHEESFFLQSDFIGQKSLLEGIVEETEHKSFFILSSIVNLISLKDIGEL